MKKIFALVLVLALVLSISVFSFAEDVLSPGAGDVGPKVIVDDGKVVKDVDSALAELKETNPAKAAELEAFFEEAKVADDTITYGVIDLGGEFEDADEETVSVPVAAPSVVKGQTVKVTLSDGTVIEVLCEEDGVVYIPVPRDAENLGYVISVVS